MNLFFPSKNFLQKILGTELDFDLKNYLIRGSFYSLFIQFFSLGLNFFIGVLLARLLGADGYGFFTFAFTLLSVICTVSVFGTDDFLVRETASFQSRNNFPAITSALKWAVMRVAIFSLFITAVFFFIINFTAVFTPDKKNIFTILLIAVPVFSLTMIFQAAQRGLHRVVSGQLAEKIIRPLILIIAVAIIYFFSKKMLSPDAAIFINIFAFAVALVILLFQTKKIFSYNNTLHKIPSLWKGREARSSFYFFIATIVAVINVRADILMLGWLKTDAEVGIYNAAARFSDFTAFSLLIITPIVAPSISRLFALNEKIKLQQLVTKTAKVNFIFAVIMSGVLIFSGKFILQIFGDAFISGYLCMLLLCGGQLITTFAGPAGNILLMTGFEKYAFYSGFAGTIVNIALNFLLIPEYGINGAATATAISLFIWNGMQTFFVFRKIKINSTFIKILNLKK